MKELCIKGQQEFLGKQINVVEGGFGEDQRCIFVKDVADIHGKTTPDINKSINRNISRFGDNDLIDLKTQSSRDYVLELGFTPAQYGNSSNIFVLSERGYFKLVKIMEDDKSWEVHDKLVDEYFSMRQAIKEINGRDKLLLDLFSDDKLVVVEAHKKLIQIETKELTNKIKEDEPKVDSYNQFIDADGTYTMTNACKYLNINRGEAFKQLRELNYIYKKKTECTQKGIEAGYFRMIDKRGHACMVVTTEGIEFIKKSFQDR